MKHNESTEAERIKFLADFHAVGQVAAANLGGGWTYRQSEVAHVALQCYGYLVHTDGRRIYLQAPQLDSYYYDGKVEVSGDFGDAHFNDITPKIKVTLSRGGVALAKEIDRRFMTDFTRLHGEAVIQIAAADDRKRKREWTISTLLALAPDGRVNNDRTGVYFPSGEGRARIGVAVSVYGGVVDLKIDDVNTEVAASIIRLLRPAAVA